MEFAMTSQEILANIQIDNQTPVQSQTRWLQEIAYQLAVMNEKAHDPNVYTSGEDGVCKNCGYVKAFHDADGKCT
jgi:hypothetical protein